MKNVTIRINEETATQLSEISERPTTAAQEALEAFIWLRRATLYELKGLFSREEIIALLDSFNGLIPTWRLMVNPSTLVAHTEDAERYQGSLSMHQADPESLIAKLKKLTPAQATTLQLELWAFWNRSDNPADFETFIEMLS